MNVSSSFCHVCGPEGRHYGGKRGASAVSCAPGPSRSIRSVAQYTNHWTPAIQILRQHTTPSASEVVVPTVLVESARSTSATSFAQILGWLVIVGSWFRSVPQIARIIRAKSAEGVSVTASIVEMLCYTVIVGYNVNLQYPISSYGDVFACWIQDIIVAGLLMYHMKTPTALLWSSIAAFCMFNYWIISGSCGMPVLISLQLGVAFAMSFGARLPQIWLNFKRGNSGELSIITFALSTIGNLIRIYTTVVLTADLLLLASTTIQFLFNAIITIQCLQTELRNRKAAAHGMQPTNV